MSAPAEEFESLLEPLLNLVYRVAYNLAGSREEAENLVQEASLRAYKGFHGFTRGTNFKSWFLKIMKNVYWELGRRSQRKPQTCALDDAPDLYLFQKVESHPHLKATQDPAHAVLDRLSSEQVARAIGALPFDYRYVCVLYFLEEKAYAEISELLEVPVGTVRSRLHRGRKLLQKSLWEVAVAEGILEVGAAR